MYAPIYNRLCGWLFFALGMFGLFFGEIGQYLQFTQTESVIDLCFGIAAMAFARTRKRYSVVAALGFGMLMFLWGIWGATWPNSVLGTAEPLEVLIRLLTGVWGMYVSVQDVLEWRRSSS